jgi:hypothetical protein
VSITIAQTQRVPDRQCHSNTTDAETIGDVIMKLLTTWKVPDRSNQDDTTDAESARWVLYSNSNAADAESVGRVMGCHRPRERRMVMGCHWRRERRIGNGIPPTQRESDG